MNINTITHEEIEALNPQDRRVLENRVRRMADRQGLAVRKSRRRDPRAVDYNSYWLFDPYSNTAVTHEQFGLFLWNIIQSLLDDSDETDQ